MKHIERRCAPFVCLFNRSVRADTRMGPEGTKLKQKPEPDLKSLDIACVQCQCIMLTEVET